VNKCHQFEQRERAMIEDDLSREQDTELDYKIEAISPADAATFIRRYEYLGTVGRNRGRYGALNTAGELAAVAVFGSAAPMPAGTITLERGACAPWAHPHCASWFIPRAVRRAAQDHGWHTFIAFADPEAHEVGVVYQASNWKYLGQSPGRLVGGRPRLREYFTDGKVTITERAYRLRGLAVGDMDLLGWRRIFREPKHKYGWIEGTWTRDERGRLRGPRRSEIRALWAQMAP
jgi:hypothetical protein